MKRLKVSNNVIRRLPRYLRRLDELAEHGVVRVSSAELGRQMGITPSQIRQDLSSFGEFGLQGYGYSVKELRMEISSILGADSGFTAVLVGVGKIGSALMSNFSFADCGVALKAAFDVREDLVGQTVDGIPVYHMNELEAYLRNNHIDIAVLAVPKTVAVSITNLLNRFGIEAIWNFTNVEVTGPDSDMLVESVHFSDSLFALSYYLAEQRDSKADRNIRRVTERFAG